MAMAFASQDYAVTMTIRKRRPGRPLVFAVGLVVGLVAKQIAMRYVARLIARHQKPVEEPVEGE